MNTLHKIDHSAMRISQVTIILLNVLAFILNTYWITALTAAAMLLGTLLGVPGFGWIYRLLLKPLGLIKPDVLLDHPEPHRFAQGLGGAFMTAGTVALMLGAAGIGWTLVWMVAGLAALNAFAGFCAGCMIYYWLARLHVPGFDQAPPDGGLPGMRPKTRPSLND
ncbi:MAG: DUF4395 domain-containing protein [Chloroflexota bacterium]